VLKLDWDDLIDRAQKHSDLSEQERQNALSALADLKQMFGGRFFDIRHPLFDFFFNRAAWPFQWAIWFARLLSSLKQHPDFPDLIRDLELPARYGERMTILNIVEVLLAAGFLFTLDKQVQIRGTPKKPDLFVRANQTDPGFFIEVASLSLSQKEREAHRIFEALQETLFPFGDLESSGWCERILSEKHLQEILERIRQARIIASKMGFESIEVERVIHLAFATKASHKKLEEWATARGLEIGEFRGPPVNVSEIDRIAFKLQKEQEQLPTDLPNVVVIYPHNFCQPPKNEVAFREFAHALEEEVYKHGHITYVALVFRWIGGNHNGIFRWQDHLCVNKTRRDFECDSTMLFKNRFADHQLPPATAKKLLEAFTIVGSNSYADRS
jgi:hypothetical protein